MTSRARRPGALALLAASCLLAVVGCRRSATGGPGASASSASPSASAGSASAASAASVPGPSPSAPVAAGTSVASLRVAGTWRTYRVHRPPAPVRPAPLVVVLHGGFGSAAQAQEAYGWDAVADRWGAVVAYPEGLGRAWNVGGGCCGPASAAGVDDVAFVRAVVADLSARLPVDGRRVYATGISNGGMLAYRLACDTALFAAVAPVAGTLLGPCPAPHPVSLLHVHGRADGVVRYLGGPGAGLVRIDGPAVPGLVARWRSADGCGTPTVQVSGSVTTSLASCPAGRAVELVTVAGAGHQWPGSRPLTRLERLIGLDTPSPALDATDLIWRFFRAHPSPGG